jgi:alkanesulfonate monooxygenase SsuD/methylene tetrahydromethanopterin reductase-like flavin-dependent oxidoreductase (luciferase family)
MTTAPKVGYFVTSMVGGMRDGALRWTDIRALASRAEEAGFDSFWIPDHLLFRNPGEAPHGPWECWSLMAALAATTSRMELGTLVSCTSFRNPALLAKMVDTIEEISGGRLILGLGAGWHEPEYEAFGFPFDRRFARFEEAVHIIRTLLREGRMSHEGAFHTLVDCELRPRGPRPDGPPIMIGALATKPRMLGLIARYADLWNGWLVHGRSHADEVPPLTSALDAACLEAGRDPASIRRTIGILVDQRPAGERGAVPGSAAIPLAGEPQEIAAGIRAIGAHGIEHVQIAPVVQGIPGVEAFAAVIELLRQP